MRDILNYIAYPSGQSFTTDLRDNISLTFPSGTTNISVSIELEFDTFYNLFRAWKPVEVNGVNVENSYPFFKSGLFLWEITTDLVISPNTTSFVIQTYGTQNAAALGSEIWTIVGQPTYTNLTYNIEGTVVDNIVDSGSQTVTE